jgi:hypothetical protein
MTKMSKVVETLTLTFLKCAEKEDNAFKDRIAAAREALPGLYLANQSYKEGRNLNSSTLMDLFYDKCVSHSIDTILTPLRDLMWTCQIPDVVDLVALLDAQVICLRDANNMDVGMCTLRVHQADVVCEALILICDKELRQRVLHMAQLYAICDAYPTFTAKHLQENFQRDAENNFGLQRLHSINKAVFGK